MNIAFEASSIGIISQTMPLAVILQVILPIMTGIGIMPDIIGMGIIPLEFPAGETAESLGLTGLESISIDGIAAGLANRFADGKSVCVRAVAARGDNERKDDNGGETRGHEGSS